MAKDSLPASAYTGLTLYGVYYNASMEVYDDNAGAYEAYDAGSWTDYDVAATEQGSSGVFVITRPATVDATAEWSLHWRQNVSGTAAVTDPIVGIAGSGVNVTRVNGSAATFHDLPSIEIAAPYDTEANVLTIIQGDAYLTSMTEDGTALDIAITDGGTLPDDITGSTVTLKLNPRLKTGTTVTYTGSTPTPSGATKTFRFTPTAAETAALTPGENAYDGYVVVLVGGVSTAVRKFPIRVDVTPDLL